MCLNLSTQILDFDKTRLERHDQRALELVLGSVEFGLRYRALIDGTGAEFKFACNDVGDAAVETWVDGGRDTEQARVGVAVVEGSTVVDAVVLIEDVGVETRVHAFAWTAGGEAAATS